MGCLQAGGLSQKPFEISGNYCKHLENFSRWQILHRTKETNLGTRALTGSGTKPRTREKNNEYPIDDSSGIAFGWRLADVALQFGLGILSGRRSGIGSSYYVGARAIQRKNRVV